MAETPALKRAPLLQRPAQHEPPLSSHSKSPMRRGGLHLGPWPGRAAISEAGAAARPDATAPRGRPRGLEETLRPAAWLFLPSSPLGGRAGRGENSTRSPLEGEQRVGLESGPAWHLSATQPRGRLSGTQGPQETAHGWLFTKALAPLEVQSLCHREVPRGLNWLLCTQGLRSGPGRVPRPSASPCPAARGCALLLPHAQPALPRGAGLPVWRRSETAPLWPLVDLTPQRPWPVCVHQTCS